MSICSSIGKYLVFAGAIFILIMTLIFAFPTRIPDVGIGITTGLVSGSIVVLVEDMRKLS